MKLDNLLSKRFGRYTVIGFSHRDKLGKIFWMCRCDCGTEKSVDGFKLKSGHTKSCGCYNREKARLTKTIHKDSIKGHRKRLYSIWVNIKQRCFNQKATSYPRYGGKGITMCEEWENDYRNFKAWALCNGYDDDLTIDRIDNKGNYEPLNCRWVTCKDQSRNTSRNKLFEHNGKVLCLSEWCELLNLNYGTILHRVRRGKTFQEAIAFGNNRMPVNLERALITSKPENTGKGA
jgi:hypothetical protein